MSKPLSESEKLITEKSLLSFPDMLFEQTSPEGFYKPFADYFREKFELTISPSVTQEQTRKTSLLAQEAHKNQKRRFINPHTGKPFGYFSVHLRGVAEDALPTLLSKIPPEYISCPPGLMQIVAYCHDIIEDRKDTKMTVDILRKKLKEEVELDPRIVEIVIEAVLFLTKPDIELPEGVTDKNVFKEENKEEYERLGKIRDQAYYENLATAPFWVKVIKLSDNLHNLSTIEGQGSSEKALKNIIKIRKSWEIIFTPEERKILSKDHIIPPNLEERTRSLEIIYKVLYTQESISKNERKIFLHYTADRVNQLRAMGGSQKIPSYNTVLNALKNSATSESKEIITSMWQFFTISYETLHPALVNAEGAKGLQRLWQKEYLEEMNDNEFYALFKKTFVQFRNEEGEMDYAKIFEALKILHLSTLSIDSGEKNVLSRAHQNNNPHYILLQEFFMRTEIYGRLFIRLDSENLGDMQVFQNLIENLVTNKKDDSIEEVLKRAESLIYEQNVEKWHSVMEEANTLLEEVVMRRDMSKAQQLENRKKAMRLVLIDANDIEALFLESEQKENSRREQMFSVFKPQLLQEYPFVVNMLTMLERKQ